MFIREVEKKNKHSCGCILRMILPPFLQLKEAAFILLMQQEMTNKISVILMDSDAHFAVEREILIRAG